VKHNHLYKAKMPKCKSDSVLTHEKISKFRFGVWVTVRVSIGLELALDLVSVRH